MAGQVQMLEAARTRLEMSHEQMRKEHKKEMQQREEEVEEVRIAAQKKVKGNYGYNMQIILCFYVSSLIRI